ncbi:mucin-2-like [Adelges cooleyi]|uniref:mucin-2-like n=1 Tax=Adelges cooleyi TaxID=133065 RepID=UPI0021807C0D|nr:mucin-2-like [Adelges cooleyi]
MVVLKTIVVFAIVVITEVYNAPTCDLGNLIPLTPTPLESSGLSPELIAMLTKSYPCSFSSAKTTPTGVNPSFVKYLSSLPSARASSDNNVSGPRGSRGTNPAPNTLTSSSPPPAPVPSDVNPSLQNYLTNLQSSKTSQFAPPAAVTNPVATQCPSPPTGAPCGQTGFVGSGPVNNFQSNQPSFRITPYGSSSTCQNQYPTSSVNPGFFNSFANPQRISAPYLNRNQYPSPYLSATPNQYPSTLPPCAAQQNSNQLLFNILSNALASRAKTYTCTGNYAPPLTATNENLSKIEFIKTLIGSINPSPSSSNPTANNSPLSPSTTGSSSSTNPRETSKINSLSPTTSFSSPPPSAAVSNDLIKK